MVVEVVLGADVDESSSSGGGDGGSGDAGE